MRKSHKSPLMLEPGEGKRGEDGYLGYLLRQAGTALRAYMERALTDLDITPPQFAVMTMLANYPGLSNADLARLSLLTPQTVSVIVSNLKRSGLLASKPHEVHGRIQTLELTEAGKNVLARCKRRVLAVEKQLGSGLTQKEEQIVRRWLVSIAVNPRTTPTREG
jgi:DNA-binding MarR family transcriptional regulator